MFIISHNQHGNCDKVTVTMKELVLKEYLLEAKVIPVCHLFRPFVEEI